MNPLGVSEPRWFSFRRLLSAGVWLLLPALTLLAVRPSPWQGYFRVQPFNDSYDGMFVAAAAGVGLTSLWVLFSCGKRRRVGNHPVLPSYCFWLNAFDLSSYLPALPWASSTLWRGRRVQGSSGPRRFSACSQAPRCSRERRRTSFSRRHHAIRF